MVTAKEQEKAARQFKDSYCLNFLASQKTKEIRREEALSIEAGRIVGELYDELLKQYKKKDDFELKSLNMLCVRLVFCLYAEDSGIFGHRQMFHDYLESYNADNVREALQDLFRILDQKPEERDPYLSEKKAAFPYVNGGLFKDTNIAIPPFNDTIRDLLLNKAGTFDWSEISPTIFGAVFESTLNPETRRSGGMHYTSIENIHKVTDPLFLDGLKEEFAKIKETRAEKTRFEKLAAFQDKLASLTFLDPACGSGNFLTETYLSLRRIENEIISILNRGQILMGSVENPIKVQISQFYGIEINDFAVTVAKTALWIAESQMIKETEAIVSHNIDFLPLKTGANIVEGNALRMDWGTLRDSGGDKLIYAEKLNVYQVYDLDGTLEVHSPTIEESGRYKELNVVARDINVKRLPKAAIIAPVCYNYIMGNPPFVGYSLQSERQKEDIRLVYVDAKGKPYKTAGKVDYVAAWYFKASQFVQQTHTRCAFVSTNSITQGEQVASVWSPLIKRFGIHIDFAWKTFKWSSESFGMAAVHCVIIGFSSSCRNKPVLYESGRQAIEAGNINPYLIDAPTAFIESRNKPLCIVPDMVKGSSPVDGGNLLLDEEEYADFIKTEPGAAKFLFRFLGAKEYLHNIKRWCLWLEGASPAEINRLPELKKRIAEVKKFRAASSKAATRKFADEPTRFMEMRQPKTQYILIPRHSSENRKYVPFGFMEPTVICGDANNMLPNATLYHFGVMISRVHMAWMRVVCGRIKSDYRYSNDIVYNNFPWCTPDSELEQKIRMTAQGILDVRAKYPDSCLAELYDEMLMPSDLRKAHEANDKAVMKAYGFPLKLTENEIVARLMELYKKQAAAAS